MKKGFTLVELMAVVIILAVIGLIAIPTVNKVIKDNQLKLYQAQISSIDDAAKAWSDKHINLLPEKKGEAISIPLILLKQEGLLPLDFKNPKTNEEFYDNMYIDIIFEENSYTYNVIEDSGNSYFDIDVAPIIIKDTYNYDRVNRLPVCEVIVFENGRLNNLISDLYAAYNIDGTRSTISYTYNEKTFMVERKAR